MPIEVEHAQGDDEDESPPIVGYIRKFGVRATAETLAKLVTNEVPDGHILWDRTEWHEVNPETLDADIRKRMVAVSGEGIWYRSGRAFYPEDEEDSVNIQ
ncbi:MAG TPA: hypothetical protein VJ837_04305 [Candidatus Paceibacterota bacterium]|nr:hypothetical protein [Candidatus Paceibacterota bacterium]